MARTGSQSLFAGADLVVLGDAVVGGSHQVNGNFTTLGTMSASSVVPSAMSQNTLTGIGNSLTTPGYYVYQSANVQALLPSASLLPGATFVFAPYVAPYLGSLGGTNIVLTGSAVWTAGNNSAAFYQQFSGSGGGTGNTRGRFLTTATSGSVALMSDGIMWNVMFSSGSVTLS